MSRKTICAFIIVIIIGAGAFLYLQKKTGLGFDPGNRYKSTSLDYMRVIYNNRSDIVAFNEGYSESENCPWGFIHNGIDYFFRNASTVVAAAPGQVISITVTDNGASAENRFHVSIDIRFNASVVITYNFEPWTQQSADKDRLLSLIEVQEGDWVGISDKIATFLAVGSGAHIHFGVLVNHEARCPRQFFSDDEYIEIMTMIHSFHPDWDLCYP